MHHPGSRVAVALAACAVAASVPAFGRPDGSLQQSLVFHARTDVVFVDVSVRRGNLPISGLAAADFRLTDNTVVQQVETVSRTTVPIDVTVVLDTSPSLSALADELKREVQKITTLLGEDDRWRLLTFGYGIDDVFGWQQGRGRPNLDRVRIGRASPVYDALILALLHQPAAGRRHLVVAFTDGVEGGSILDSRALVEVANRVEAVMHIVIVESRNDEAAGRPPVWMATAADEQGMARLSEAAARTGGALYRSPGRLIEAFEQVLSEFRASYLLQYTPTGVTHEGWHEIGVAVNRPAPVSVRARRGYFGG